MNITIPDNLCQQLKKQAKEKNFDSTDEYIIFILEKVIKKMNQNNQSQSTSYSSEEKENIEKRLKDLGYLK